MKSDGTFVDKRAQRIIEEVESIVVSEHPSTDETDSQGSNSEASITPLMRDEAFYKVNVRLFCGSLLQMLMIIGNCLIRLYFVMVVVVLCFVVCV